MMFFPLCMQYLVVDFFGTWAKFWPLLKACLHRICLRLYHGPTQKWWEGTQEENLSMAKPELSCKINSTLYPTYDVDQSYRQGSILDIALWLGQYHDIAQWYS